MISTVVIPHIWRSDSLGPATNCRTSSDEVDNCEQTASKMRALISGVAAMSHELRQGFTFFWGASVGVGDGRHRRAAGAHSDAEDLVHHLTREFDSLATLQRLPAPNRRSATGCRAVRTILLQLTAVEPEAHKKGIRIRFTLKMRSFEATPLARHHAEQHCRNACDIRTREM